LGAHVTSSLVYNRGGKWGLTTNTVVIFDELSADKKTLIVVYLPLLSWRKSSVGCRCWARQSHGVHSWGRAELADGWEVQRA